MFWLLTDIDECLEPSMCLYGDCTNTVGSYMCTCDTGFEGSACSQGKIKYSNKSQWMAVWL